MERIIDKLSRKNIIEKKKSKADKIVNGMRKLGYILSFIGSFYLFGGYVNSYYQKNKQYNIADELIGRNLPATDKTAFYFLQENPNLINEFPDNNFEKLKNLKRVVLDNKYSNQDSTNLESMLISMPELDDNLEIPKEKIYEDDRITDEEANGNLISMPKFNLVFDSKDNVLYRLNSENQILENRLKDIRNFIASPEGAYFIQGKNLFIITEEKNKKIYEFEIEKGFFKKILNTPYYAIFDEIVDQKTVSLWGYDKSNDQTLPLQNLLRKLNENSIDSDIKIVYKNNTLYAFDPIDFYKVSKDKILEETPPGIIKDYLILDINDDGVDEVIISESRNIFSDSYLVYSEYSDSPIYNINHESNLKFNKPISEDFKLLMNPTKLKKQIKEKLKQ